MWCQAALHAHGAAHTEQTEIEFAFVHPRCGASHSVPASGQSSLAIWLAEQDCASGVAAAPPEAWWDPAWLHNGAAVFGRCVHGGSDYHRSRHALGPTIPECCRRSCCRGIHVRCPRESSICVKCASTAREGRWCVRGTWVARPRSMCGGEHPTEVSREGAVFRRQSHTPYRTG